MDNFPCLCPIGTCRSPGSTGCLVTLEDDPEDIEELEDDVDDPLAEVKYHDEEE